MVINVQVISVIFMDAVVISMDMNGIKTDCWTESGHDKASKEILEKFARTAKLMTSNAFNYFRGTNDDNTMIDLDNIRYIFD